MKTNQKVGQIESDLKSKASAYNSLKSNLQNIEKKQTGSLVTRNLGDLVKKAGQLINFYIFGILTNINLKMI